MPDWPPKKTLDGKFVRLEPLELSHAAGLLRAATPDTFQHMIWTPEPWGVEGFEEYIRRRQANTVPYAVVWKETNEVVGSTTFLDLIPEHRGLEIGYTWYARNWRGTAVNPESKLLLLSRAFDEVDCVRVQLKCDNTNEASKAAILKLGAQFEGVRRHNMILADGRLRNTAYFSILRDEWPDVRARLVERISGS